MMKIYKTWCMPNKNTFSIKPINNLIMKYVNKNEVWVDPFARNNKIANITNDLDPECSATYNMDALIFMRKLKTNSVNGVLFDPPYSHRQVSECYKRLGQTVNMQTTQSSFWGNLKKQISRVIKQDGHVITFGWNSGGVGKNNGFTQIEILLVAHGGWHNDTICTVEVKSGE